jgi:hypothetical protein
MNLLHARWLLSVLLVIGAGLMTIAVVVERAVDDHDRTEASAHAAASETSEHEEPAEGADRDAGTVVEHTEVHESDHEDLLGVPESGPLVVIGLCIAVGLAALVWRRNDPWLLLSVAAFAGVIAVFDVAEGIQQINSERAGLAVLATIVALAHGTVMLVAVRRARPAGD